MAIFTTPDDRAQIQSRGRPRVHGPYCHGAAQHARRRLDGRIHHIPDRREWRSAAGRTPDCGDARLRFHHRCEYGRRGCAPASDGSFQTAEKLQRGHQCHGSRKIRMPKQETTTTDSSLPRRRQRGFYRGSERKVITETHSGNQIVVNTTQYQPGEQSWALCSFRSSAWPRPPRAPDGTQTTLRRRLQRLRPTATFRSAEGAPPAAQAGADHHAREGPGRFRRSRPSASASLALARRHPARTEPRTITETVICTGNCDGEGLRRLRSEGCACSGLPKSLTRRRSLRPHFAHFVGRCGAGTRACRVGTPAEALTALALGAPWQNESGSRFRSGTVQ